MRRTNLPDETGPLARSSIHPDAHTTQWNGGSLRSLVAAEFVEHTCCRRENWVTNFESLGLQRLLGASPDRPRVASQLASTPSTMCTTRSQ